MEIETQERVSCSMEALLTHLCDTHGGQWGRRVVQDEAQVGRQEGPRAGDRQFMIRKALS